MNSPELWSDCKAGSESARCQLIEQNRYLVAAIVKKHFWFTNRAVLGRMEFGDLMAHGVIGLAAAVDKFDPSRGLKFSTMAHHWIYQAIWRGIQLEAEAIRLPEEQWTKRRQEARNGVFDPNRGHVAASLDDIDDEAGSLYHVLESEDERPEARVMRLADMEVVREAVERLEEHHRDSIKFSYGIGCKRLTLDEAGRRMGVSRQAVQQRCAQGMKLLRPILSSLVD